MQVLDKLDLNDTTVQHVLLACTPPLPDSAMPQVESLFKHLFYCTTSSIMQKRLLCSITMVDRPQLQDISLENWQFYVVDVVPASCSKGILEILPM